MRTLIKTIRSGQWALSCLTKTARRHWTDTEQTMNKQVTGCVSCVWQPRIKPVIVKEAEVFHVTPSLRRGFPGGANSKESTWQCIRCKRHGFNPWVRQIPRGGNGNAWRILAWRIPWTEETGGLWSMGSQRVGHNWAHIHTHITLRKLGRKAKCMHVEQWNN